MRLLDRNNLAIARSGRLGLVLTGFLLALAAASAQTAPYILPYTMSTFAGPNAAYTVPSACSAYIALTSAGDGCLRSAASIGADPHDIRVDSQGNVYWMDDSNTVIHKISAVTGRMTVYVGGGKSPCAAASTKQGDNCPANDGAGNVSSTTTTCCLAKGRGLAVGANGDLFFADYNGDQVHKVSAATGIFSLLAGNGTATSTASGNTANPPIGGPPGTSQVGAARGVGVDAYGNVYVADFGDGVIRFIYGGVFLPPGVATVVSSPTAGYIYTLTVFNTSAVNPTPVIASGITLASTQLFDPEDVQVDSNGNVYIAEFGNNIVRALYNGKGSLPGISNPITGYVYLVAGYAAGVSTASNTYPTNGTTPTFPATTIGITDRKMAIDARNNLYIADSSHNVVWFVDATTGNIRLLAGNLGATAGAPATGCAASTDTVGDGCPGPLASLYTASDMGVDPDNQGNLYITDAENGVIANSRLRKLLSGLNFPATAKGSSVVQTLLIHFAVGDSMATANAFVIKSPADYVAGTPSCIPETDGTSDCTLPITFAPTQPGYDTATLTITSTLGGSNSYLLTGTGTMPAVAIDPGSVSVLNTSINNAQGMAMDGAGNIYTADTGNNRVLLYTASTGITTTFAGTGAAGYAGDTGLATAATFKAPKAVAIDTSGSVYISDTGNNVIRKVTSNGIYAGGATTVCAASLNVRGDGCPALQATLSAPSGLVADNLGLLYVSDSGNNVIRAINVLGNIATLAGGATATCSAAVDVFGDGCLASQTIFKAPTGLAFDAAGNNLIVADTGDNIVRTIYLANTIVETGTTTIVSTVAYNPVTLIAGTGAAGDVLNNNGTATLSQLSAPSGVAVDSGENIYIADAGNSAVRLVSHSGIISTIVGVLGGAGTGTTPGSAANVQLTSPAAVAVTPVGVLQIEDSGNNRVLTDQRSQVSFNFGRTNEGFASPLQNFIESSIGTTAVNLQSPLLTQSVTQTQFVLGPVTGSTGCITGTFAVGGTCILQGQFTPATTGNFTDTFTEAGSGAAAGDPSITLVGVGAVLTKTTSVVAQSAPAGNSQFGATATMTATVTPAACNTAAPNCYPTGTVRFIVDGGNPGSPIAIAGSSTTNTSAGSQVISSLAVGSHTVACNYSGDNFYAASSCGTITITVTQGSTTPTLVVTNNNQTQYNNCLPVNTLPQTCGTSVLTVTVVSNTIATAFPTGSVNFYAGTTLLGTSQVNATNGVATFTLAEALGADGNPVTDNTLAPGTYSLNCTYSGSANFAASSCAGVTFTVLPSPVAFTIATRGCLLTSLYANGTSTPSLAVPCAVNNVNSGFPQIDTAQGSTADASIFIRPSNTLSGTLTFSCSGLPQFAKCSFLPTSITVTPSTSAAAPIATDMTLWTDINPSTYTGSLHPAPGARNDTSFAAVLGWPVTLLGLAGILRFRRRMAGNRGLHLLALLLVLAGSSIVFAGCAGPGAVVPVLTPGGAYPITVTVTGDGITQTTTVYFVVGAPGLVGQE
jgi:sugar lactone lactonase YvrE